MKRIILLAAAVFTVAAMSAEKQTVLSGAAVHIAGGTAYHLGAAVAGTSAEAATMLTHGHVQGAMELILLPSGEESIAVEAAQWSLALNDRTLIVKYAGEETCDADLRVADLTGTIQYADVVSCPEACYDLSSLASGIYIIYLSQNGNQLKTAKLIVK